MYLNTCIAHWKGDEKLKNPENPVDPPEADKSCLKKNKVFVGR